MVCLGILILKSTENFQVILSEIIELWKRFFESALYFRWRENLRSLVPGQKECGQLSAYVFSCVECFLQAMPIGWSHKTFFVEAREFRIKRTVGSRG